MENNYVSDIQWKRLGEVAVFISTEIVLYLDFSLNNSNFSVTITYCKSLSVPLYYVINQ